MKRDILKNVRVRREGIEMKYGTIAQPRPNWSVSTMCQKLNCRDPVSMNGGSASYAWSFENEPTAGFIASHLVQSDLMYNNSRISRAPSDTGECLFERQLAAADTCVRLHVNRCERSQVVPYDLTIKCMQREHTMAVKGR